jgi:hypothetical protein
VVYLLVAVLGGGAAQGQDWGLFGKKKDKEEETWAIRCFGAVGADRARHARAYADALKKVKGLKGDLVRVVDLGGETVIYYGKYQRVYDAKKDTETFKPDHLADLNLIRNLSCQSVGGTDQWPFLMATMEPLPGATGANPAWNFENADGYYSLHVAVFYNTENMRSRKFAAEEYCKLLRAQGEEAYYHHGTVNSSVYIGAFPKSAIVEVKREDPLSGAVTMVNRIVDPRLLELQKKYPVSLHNGHTMYEVTRDPKTSAVQSREPAPSFPVVMPKADKKVAELGAR